MNSDYERILALPKARPRLDRDLAKALKRRGGKMKLWDSQIRMLSEARAYGGLVASAPVGTGKELTSLLLPVVLHAQRPLLVVPSSTVSQVFEDFETYGRHFIMHPRLKIMTYEQLSSPKKWAYLEKYRPDLIVLNESHLLKTNDAARTSRFARFLKQRPRTRVCALTGTLMSVSAEDLMEVFNWALKKQSPTPLSYLERERWAKAVDRWGGHTSLDRDYFAPLMEKHGAPTPIEAFAAQLASTGGVVLLEKTPVKAKLNIETWDIEMPAPLREALEDVEKMSELVGEAVDERQLGAKRRQLAQGFFYRYSDKVNPDWAAARSGWFSAVGSFLKEHARRGMDTPGLVYSALKRYGYRGSIQRGFPAYLVSAWMKWSLIRHVKPPPKVARWLTSYLVDDIVKRAREAKGPVLLWYESRAMGIRLHKKTGWPIFMGGDEDATRLREYRGKQPVIVSRNAFGRGLNLQYFASQIFTGPVSDPIGIEQALGRHHRPGQPRPEVWAYFYSHLVYEETLNTALAYATKIGLITNQHQKILVLRGEADDQDDDQSIG